MADQPAEHPVPVPGTPEFLEWLERTKDAIERATGVRPDAVQASDPDAWRNEMRRQLEEDKKPE